MKVNFRKILSAVLVLVMILSMLPAGIFRAEAASAVVDVAVMFSDLHTNKSNYKESNLKGVLNAFKNAGLTPTSVTSCGDAFSVNEDSSGSNGPYTGYTATLNGYIHDVFAGVDINYVWSDHDRYAVQEDGTTLLDKKSQLVYGAGEDGVYGTGDDDNYYVYALSMGDLCSYDRYKAGFNYTLSANSRASKGFTATVPEAIEAFKAAVAQLDPSKPLFIASHQPLFDNRNDNAWAEEWFDAINEVAENMDVAYFFGHNHKYDTSSDYYYAKGSKMPVATADNWNYNYETGSGYKPSVNLGSESKTLNFTHMCAGYLEPTSTGSYSSSTTRLGTALAITIYEDSIQYTTYNSSGVYSGNYALNVNVERDHASAITEPEVTEPEVTEPEVTEPETPEVSGTIWRQASSIENGQRYILVNYGYNGSGTGTYAVDSSASAQAVTVMTDANGAYIVNDDEGIVWTAKANSNQFTLSNAETGYYLRSGGYVYNNSGSAISVNQSTGSSSYSNWSLETKNGRQVLAVRRSSSSNYYPVRYTGSNFQAFNSSKVSSMDNWLTVFVETEENAHEHSYTASVTEPTCAEAGFTTYTCACGDSYTGNAVAALGHNYSCAVTEATCAANGSKVYTCLRCDHTYTEVIPATGSHTGETVTVAATCTENGSVTTTCTVCGKQTVEVLQALGHDYSRAVTEATCTADGSKVYTCLRCGETYTEVIPATGHKYTAVTLEPTCEADGSVTYTCACGETYTEVLAALGHSYEAAVTAPTCESAGFTNYTCGNCGASFVSDEKAALGHSYTAIVTEATCTKDGYTTHICGNCDHSYVSDTVAAFGHDYDAVVTAPTCESDGYTTYTCSVCRHGYIGNTVAALGHSYEAVVTAPTCTEAGFTAYTCGSCGHSYTGDQTSALGHSYTCVEADGFLVYTCGGCGHSYSEQMANLTYTKVSALSSGEGYVITLYSGSKYYALSHADNKLSAVRVTVSGDEITSEVTEDLVWTYSGSKLSYEDDGQTYYLYAQSASGWFNWGTPTLTVSTSNSSTVSLSSKKLKVGSYYLRYSNGSVSLNRSATTTYAFLEG